MRAFMLVTVQSLVAMLDHITPCFIGVNEKLENNNLRRLTRLVAKIVRFITRNFDQHGQAHFVDALLFGAGKHRGGRRNDKITPYFLRCLEVVCFLIDLDVTDLDTLIAAILHDTMEDGGATKKEIVGRFGVTVCRIVELLSKHRKKTLAMFYYHFMRSEPDDVIRAKAIIVKFPDRAHSLGTLEGLDDARKVRIQDETRREFPELFTALVESLGRLPPEKKQGLPKAIAEDLRKLIFGRL